MKLNKPVFLILLSLLLFFIVWSFFQPSGLLSAIKNNLSLISYIKQLATTPEQFEPTPDSSTSIPVLMLTARQALRQNEPERAYELITPILNHSDRWIMSTYAEILYKNEKYLNAIHIWEKLNDIITLERALHEFENKGDRENFLLARQTLYRMDAEKYTSGLILELINQKRLDEAAQILISSINNYPDANSTSDWFRYLADIYVSQNKWQEAEVLYLQTIAKNPIDQKAFRNLGLLYLSHLNNLEKAIECFTELTEISPNEVTGYRLLAQAYELSGNYDEALQTFKIVLTKSPSDQTALQAIERLTKQDQSNP